MFLRHDNSILYMSIDVSSAVCLRPQDCSCREKRFLFRNKQPQYQAHPRWSPLSAEGHHEIRLRTGSSPSCFLKKSLSPCFAARLFLSQSFYSSFFFKTETVHDGERGPPRASQPPGDCTSSFCAATHHASCLQVSQTHTVREISQLSTDHVGKIVQTSR